MIKIINKEDCVGCNGCVQICPKKCISFNEDEQGFRYPKVNLDLCIHCNLCEKVCPVINQAEPKNPIHAYAGKNLNNSIQEISSSGGIFFALAEKTINEGGVVFGAKFNDYWEVIHDYTDKIDGIKDFQRSKYVQSYIGDSFIKVRDFLKQGTKVLFSGTPCQIAGLKLFLKYDFEDLLITIDTVCHGVPSPKVWKDYLAHLSKTCLYSFSCIKEINFRDKRNGWDHYGFSIKFEKDNKHDEYFSKMQDNIYMQGFLKDLYLRLSCYACPAKSGKSCSNITLGDFWGIKRGYPDLYRDRYYSLVLANNAKGMELLAKLKSVQLSRVSYEVAVKGNPALVKSSKLPNRYSIFWDKYTKEGIPALIGMLNSMKPTFFSKCKYLINNLYQKYLD